VPESIRPTTELARKAAFDILGGAVRDARVLDAAAGSGAYGIEALSRGARNAVFVEADRRVKATLERNLETLGLEDRARVVGEPVARFAARAEAGSFDVVFHDPPWEDDTDADLEALLRLVASGGVLFHERGDSRAPATSRAASERRRYGRTHLSIFRV
jgi:16S rRNA (guanine966-N2)-methyltransferase